MGATGEKLKPTGEKSKPSGEKNRGAGERVGRNISPQSRALCANGSSNFFLLLGRWGEDFTHKIKKYFFERFYTVFLKRGKMNRLQEMRKSRLMMATLRQQQITA